MPAAYDNYDYPSYWKDRKYEHNSEVYALRRFLERIPQIKSVLEIGAGYGRLTNEYEYRANRVALTDPSAKLLKVARSTYKGKKYKFIQSSLERLDSKVRSRSYDLVIMIRVLHHIQDPENSFKNVYKFLKPGGYFILEFPNKKNFKASMREMAKGDVTYPINIFAKDMSTKKSTLPFYNYHPDKIKHCITSAGFKILSARSVSNIRSRRIKKLVGEDTLLEIEKRIQIPLSHIDFGPSIFILAQKK